MRWLKDPLWLFLAVGTILFVLAGWWTEDEIPYRIDIGANDLQRLNDQWSMQMRRPATTEELAGLVEQFVKEEIYYREARRMGLDANDTIVRRRLVQKLTFLTEDLATAEPLDDVALRQYYTEHRENYQLPDRYTFSHRYFSVDRRANAEEDARLALEDAARAGDPFMLQKSYAQRSIREIGDLFGREFADQLASLSVEKNWQGPLRSAYGWHAVQLTAKINREVQSFEAVKGRVAVDAQQAIREAANSAYYADLKSRYDIHYPDGE
ncbi:MAG: peptidylprolyl isomerase [Pseudomonadota bacterium]